MVTTAGAAAGREDADGAERREKDVDMGLEAEEEVRQQRRVMFEKVRKRHGGRHS